MTMNSNDVMESSTLVALTGLNVVIEDESEYVFIAEGDLNLDEWNNNDDDESSYDHCDLSTTLSCATSVATNVTLRDLNLIEEEDSNSIVAMDFFDSIEARDDDDDDAAPADDDEDDCDGSLTKRRNDRDVLGVAKVFPFVTMANPKNGRRLSNKKLRKKLKMMKKAAAAKAAFEVAMANQKAISSSLINSSSMNSASEEEAPSSSPERTSSSASRFKSTSTSSSPSSPKRKSTRSNSIAVACAQETLAAYREEIEAGKLQKKAARFAAVV
mmetsp:Transcript_31427/g.59825  ORF Transcript_31427/g.59825 Transcript_31427/m.59825 type:complete len:271 (+) Transcript_31427:504-1316(+)